MAIFVILSFGDDKIATVFRLSTSSIALSLHSGCALRSDMFVNLCILFPTGDEIEVILDGSTDDTPFHLGSKLYNGFNGFRI